jgi:tripartite-type tricarboxylate transporter receptor subunit TctC
MKLPRRKFLHLAAGGVALPSVSRAAFALDYPTRSPRVLVGYPPGGAADIAARLAAQWLSQRFGQQFIVENRPGAANNIATETVAKATPDGYTLLLANTTNAINATLYPHLNFDLLRDIVPIAGIGQEPNVMVVNPSLPAKSVAEFIAYAKANPGKINFGSGGTGTGTHVPGALFAMMTGVEMVHVPYQGDAPALIDLMSGRVQVMFDLVTASIGFIKAGKLRALAVTTATRSEALPGVPTIAETVPGYEASSWQGLGAPRNTPREIVDRLNSEMNAAADDSAFKTRLADLGATPFAVSRADFAKFISDEIEKWAKVIKTAGITAG